MNFEVLNNRKWGFTRTSAVSIFWYRYWEEKILSRISTTSVLALDEKAIKSWFGSQPTFSKKFREWESNWTITIEGRKIPWCWREGDCVINSSSDIVTDFKKSKWTVLLLWEEPFSRNELDELCISLIVSVSQSTKRSIVTGSFGAENCNVQSDVDIFKVFESVDGIMSIMSLRVVCDSKLPDITLQSDTKCTFLLSNKLKKKFSNTKIEDNDRNILRTQVLKCYLNNEFIFGIVEIMECLDLKCRIRGWSWSFALNIVCSFSDIR